MSHITFFRPQFSGRPFEGSKGLDDLETRAIAFAGRSGRTEVSFSSSASPPNGSGKAGTTVGSEVRYLRRSGSDGSERPDAQYGIALIWENSTIDHPAGFP